MSNPFDAQELASETGLSLSTIYRRRRAGYTISEIKKEAAIMKKYKTAGSNWRKTATKEADAAARAALTAKEPAKTLATSILSAQDDRTILQKQLERNRVTGNDQETKKEVKRVISWEPADDYGLVSRLKVLGGWIVKVEKEVLFVLDEKHRWEV